MKKSLIAICLIGAMLVVFQNCADKNFSVRTDLNKSMSLDGSEQLVEDDIPNEIEDDVDELVNNDDDHNGSSTGGSSTGGSNSGSSTGGSSMAGSSGDDDDDEVAENDNDDPRGNSNGGSSTGGSTTSSSSGDDDKERGNGKNCHDKKDGNGRYVCILAGPGKSRHVAVINDQIVSENSTPKTACMSRDACEKIVGAKLEVKSVESRGYCKNETPQVLVFTDAEVQVLVDKIQ